MSPSTFVKTSVATFAFLSAAAFSYGYFAPSADAVQPAPVSHISHIAESHAQASQSSTLSAGQFTGLSKHVTTGQARLVKTASGYELVLAADFFLDGAPDPIVGFGQDGEYIKASKVAQLQSKRGEQSYTLPANFNPANFNEVYIWCEKFSVPLGVAALTTA